MESQQHKYIHTYDMRIYVVSLLHADAEYVTLFDVTLSYRTATAIYGAAIHHECTTSQQPALNASEIRIA